MSSTWGGWGTKLNMTSIVSQGLEQVRSLREDVEKSFDQVVTGAPGARASPPLAPVTMPREQIEDKSADNEADKTRDEVILSAKETLIEDKSPEAKVEPKEERIPDVSSPHLPHERELIEPASYWLGNAWPLDYVVALGDYFLQIEAAKQAEPDGEKDPAGDEVPEAENVSTLR
ncbi:Hypothetical protein PHPALM_7990, partial [Phytophthora palmivora]